MKNAKDLFLEYLENMNDVERVIELFADDAVIEIPYLETIGIPSRNVGKEGVRGFINFVFSTMPDFKFENIIVHMETPDQVFAEYSANSLVPATGKYYNQLFFGRLVAENGKIKLIREALNPVIAARAMFPNGTADIPA
ncbi:MAG: nuclear transport factor 2 family protein [Bacteroidota bacterium]|nr:nuclear transport factor 2 family protein [Bacteroidota bacterium]